VQVERLHLIYLLDVLLCKATKKMHANARCAGAGTCACYCASPGVRTGGGKYKGGNIPLIKVFDRQLKRCFDLLHHRNQGPSTACGVVSSCLFDGFALRAQWHFRSA